MMISSEKMFAISSFLWLSFYWINYFINTKSRIKNIENYLNRYQTIKREFIKFFFGVYIVYLISKVFFPLDLSMGADILAKGPTIILNPIDSIKLVFKGGVDWAIYNLGGNFILLTPLTFFLVALDTKKRINIKSATLISCYTTFFIEITQVGLSLSLPRVGRYFEVCDLILNTLGGTLGYIMFIKWEDYYKKLKEFILYKLQWN